MKTKEFSSYIKGLIEGAGLDKTTTEGKIISALADLVDQMAGEIEILEEKIETANEYLDELDEDLGAVEELIYDELDDDDDCDCDCCDCCDDDECDCDCCDCDDDDDDAELYLAMCPNCGGKVYFDDTVDPADIICPACQTSLIEDECEEV